MNKFDRYYKSKNLNVNKELINTYIKYNDNTLLISNGFSVVYTKTIASNFKENPKYAGAICNYFDNFNGFEYFKTIELIDIINNKDKENHYTFYSNNNTKYGLDYMQLKKITDIIGCIRIDIVMNQDSFKVIKIIGRNNQVGYLLPCRVF